jgi:brefeldin A-inhibited guanine nucleotide-exchange protein
MSCLNYVVQHRIQKLKSGWKTVFRILRAASKEHESEVIPECSQSLIDEVITKHYDVFVENFSDAVCALSAIAQCKASVQLSLKGVAHLSAAAAHLAKVYPAPQASSTSRVDASGDAEKNPVADWLLLLQGLSTLVSDPRPEVRVAGLTSVVDCFQKYGVETYDED